MNEVAKQGAAFRTCSPGIHNLTALQLDVINHELEREGHLQGAQLFALSREKPCCLVGTACH